MKTTITKILEKIAKENGTTPENVRQEIQKAINIAFLNPNLCACKIPSKGTVPTVEEFLLYSVNRIQCNQTKISIF